MFKRRSWSGILVLVSALSLSACGVELRTAVPTDGDGTLVATATATPTATPVCPTGFVEVPGDSALGTSNFCVMKFEPRAWQDADADGVVDDSEIDPYGCPNATCSGYARFVAGQKVPVSAPTGLPWRGASGSESFSICASLGPKYSLISNPEWMTIARNAENVAQNWSSGTVGTGCIWKGNTGTAGTCSYNAGTWETRAENLRDSKGKLTLSNGSEIWDFNSNMQEHVNWTVSFTRTYAPTGCARGYTELNAVGCSSTYPDASILPSNGTLLNANGIGQFHSSNTTNGATIRGGAYGYDSISGLYSIWAGVYPDSWVYNNTSFRCVYRP